MAVPHPLWSVGFRPFFPLAALAGLVLPVVWLLVWRGQVALPAADLPAQGLSALHWHAHEMFFGFGMAVLVGFLLTASKNWVGIVGYQGKTLMALAAAWVVERWAFNFGGGWPVALFWVAQFVFPLMAIALLLWTLLHYRQTDSYRADNVFFIAALPLLIPTKWLLLQPWGLAAGSGLALAVFRLAFLLMLERTVSAFVKSAFRLDLRPSPRLDRAIKGLALLLCGAPWLPGIAVILLEGALAGLLLWRLRGWHPAKALRRLEIGIMYGGYVAIVLQLVVDALAQAGVSLLAGSAGLHIFTLGALGCIAPAMFIRIVNGHTGRKIVFGRFEKTILYLVIAATLGRTLGVTLFPASYSLWIDGAAIAWAVAYGMWLERFLPYVWRPRVSA